MHFHAINIRIQNYFNTCKIGTHIFSLHFAVFSLPAVRAVTLVLESARFVNTNAAVETVIAITPRDRTMRQLSVALFASEAAMTFAEVIRLVQSSQLASSLVGALVVAGLVGKK